MVLNLVQTCVTNDPLESRDSFSLSKPIQTSSNFIGFWSESLQIVEGSGSF
ncbi:hypothetical protein PRUPE_5G097000 [Prunus persica]|uniref:Uncharacterized protein n=1 Tax=Prunus persica TaxID=3760 RepID=A0A251P634_PRUPE|nr:hypothetical protein PRUPE_5G097000 [Prunus persica]ONI07044.1 hypothetical protein PRUPE_5G097000 [Prunus persica]ONI07045.1 hypothetical protein PRUPE_5G097000 [Prunus persica]